MESLSDTSARASPTDPLSVTPVHSLIFGTYHVNENIFNEVLVDIHNRILLSSKKECIWVHSNEVDEPRAYYTKWSKSERERQILYISA